MKLDPLYEITSIFDPAIKSEMHIVTLHSWVGLSGVNRILLYPGIALQNKLTWLDSLYKILAILIMDSVCLDRLSGLILGAYERHKTMIRIIRTHVKGVVACLNTKSLKA